MDFKLNFTQIHIMLALLSVTSQRCMTVDQFDREYATRINTTLQIKDYFTKKNSKDNQSDLSEYKSHMILFETNLGHGYYRSNKPYGNYERSKPTNSLANSRYTEKLPEIQHQGKFYGTIASSFGTANENAGKSSINFPGLFNQSGLKHGQKEKSQISLNSKRIKNAIEQNRGKNIPFAETDSDFNDLSDRKGEEGTRVAGQDIPFNAESIFAKSERFEFESIGVITHNNETGDTQIENAPEDAVEADILLKKMQKKVLKNDASGVYLHQNKVVSETNAEFLRHPITIQKINDSLAFSQPAPRRYFAKKGFGAQSKTYAFTIEGKNSPIELNQDEDDGKSKKYLIKSPHMTPKGFVKIVHIDENQSESKIELEVLQNIAPLFPLYIIRYMGCVSNSLEDNKTELGIFLEHMDRNLNYFMNHVNQMNFTLDSPYFFPQLKSQSAETKLGLVVMMLYSVNTLHQAGIVHFDIKPDNFVIREGKMMVPIVKLIDFGVAAEIPDCSKHVRKNYIRGTTYYCDPYLVEDNLSFRLSTKSDSYSLGMTLIHILYSSQLVMTKGFNLLNGIAWMRNNNRLFSRVNKARYDGIEKYFKLQKTGRDRIIQIQDNRVNVMVDLTQRTNWIPVLNTVLLMMIAQNPDERLRVDQALSIIEQILFNINNKSDYFPVITMNYLKEFIST